ncbi:MAG TPA: hypothetical protein V6C85_22245 [Allocoleopsis sp.]
MRSLSALELLKIWEWGRTQPTWSRVLKLLATACPEMPMDKLTQFSIGQRDALLITLRERMFGSQLLSQATCPRCGECLELKFSVADIRLVSPQAGFIDQISLNVAEYEVSFRLPNSLDLIAIANCNPSVPVEEAFVKSCLLKVARWGEELSVAQWPSHVVDVVVEQMAQADPQANVQLDLSCPTCGHEWQSLFDIVSFFWSEINAWACRILREVHILASAYGWREADILAMSARRRQLYLEMVISR